MFFLKGRMAFLPYCYGLPIHCFIYLFTYLHSYLCTYLFTHLFIHSFISLFIHSSISACTFMNFLSRFCQPQWCSRVCVCVWGGALHTVNRPLSWNGVIVMGLPGSVCLVWSVGLPWHPLWSWLGRLYFWVLFMSHFLFRFHFIRLGCVWGVGHFVYLFIYLFEACKALTLVSPS